MAGNPNYTVSTAQQYIGQAQSKTLRRSVHRIVERTTQPGIQEQLPVAPESSDKLRNPNAFLQLSPSQFPSPFEMSALEAETAESMRVQESLGSADFPLAPESREHSLLLAVKQDEDAERLRAQEIRKAADLSPAPESREQSLLFAIQQDEEAEADELAAWGESLLNPGNSGAYALEIDMANTVGSSISQPSKKRRSFWDEKLLAPVVYAPNRIPGPEKKAEMVVLAPMARTGSKKGRIFASEGADEEEEVVMLAPFTYSPNSSPQLTDDFRSRSEGKTAARLPRLSTLDTSTIGNERSPTRVRFAPQTPTKFEQSVPDMGGAYEYIEASVPGISGGNHRGHTPNSSGGTEIYFSPIDATSSQAFLSSPRPSPPNSPGAQETVAGEAKEIPRSEPAIQETSGDETLQTPLSAVEAATAQLQELVLDGAADKEEKVTLTLQQVDQLSVALARTSLVSKHVQKPFYDPRSELAEASVVAAADEASLLSDASSIGAPTRIPVPPTPPISEPFMYQNDEEIGGLALLKSYKEGSPIKCASNASMKAGKRTNLTLPLGSAHSARLRIEPAIHPAGESKIVLQVLESVVDRKSGRQAFTLLSETDVSHAFVRTALTEVARVKNVTLDEVEIQTPRAPSHSASASSSARSSQVSEELDWAALDTLAPPSSPPTTPTSPSEDLVADLASSFAALTPETCTMATLTLLSHLSSLKRHYHTFLLLQPTRYHEDGMLAGLKVPYASQSLQERFGEPGSSVHIAKSHGSTTPTVQPRGFFGLSGSRFRTALVGGVARHMVAGEEFETLLDVAPQDEVVNRCRCRGVPLRKSEEENPDIWVCMVGGEFDLTVY